MLKKVYKLVFGYLLIVLGVIGLFLPILQGVLFLALGTVILSSESPTFRKFLDKVKARYPSLYQKIRSWVKKKPS